MKAKPIKIFHSYPSWMLSGVCSWSMKMLDRLDSQEFDQKILITGQPDTSGKYHLPPKDLPSINLQTPLKASPRLYRKTLHSFLAREAPCVFLPNFDFDAASLSGLLPKNVAICAGIRSDDPVYYRYAKTFGRYWDSAVAVSRHLYDTFGSCYPSLRDRLHYIPNGVEVSAAPSQVEKNPARIVYCNRIVEEQKRVFDVLAVANHLRDKNISFEIDVLGSGPDEKRFEAQIVEQGLERFVRFKGQQTHAETLNALKSASYFILPSEYEGMPNSLLEAMAASAIPFTYDIPSGIPEIIEHGVNGYIFPVGSTAELARKLGEHLIHPEMHQFLAKKAKAKIERFFSIEAMVEAYSSHFRSLGVMAKRSQCAQRDGRCRLLEKNSILKRVKRKLDQRLH
ncbi:MAG: hypothetical protein CMO55_25280 [Verrucomicrobiales bacterium]|nr:hypothetical protein [Verrucomicrobiales bacterium]